MSEERNGKPPAAGADRADGGTTAPDPEALRDENRRMRYLRHLVSLTTAVLMQGDYTLAEAQELVERTRRAALMLFPGKERAFDLIYGPRFARIILERYGSAPGERTH